MNWGAFEEAAAELATIGRERFERWGFGLLGTVRKDGAARISPCETYIVDGELLLGMMWRSTKALDLLRDPRIVVHSPVCSREGGYEDGEFKVRGRVFDVPDEPARERYADVVEAAIQWRPKDPYQLFRVELEHVAFIWYDPKAPEGEEKRVQVWTAD